MSYVPSQHKNYDMTEAAIDDRITALEAGESAIEGRVDELEKKPNCPPFPSENGNYELKVSGLIAGKTYAWDKVALPALPTEAGNYQLTVAVDGTAVSYSWTVIEAGK